MKAFVYSNQSMFYVIGVVLFLVVLYFIFKALPTKVKKKEAKVSEKKTETIAKDESKEPVKEIEVVDEIKEEKTQEENKKDKKTDKKPKIVQIYKREHKDESGEVKQKIIDPIYDRNVEFINTSKNVAKFKSFADDIKSDELDKSTDEFGFVEDKQEDCNFCENKVKHFDHSRRMSIAIKEDNFDNLFESHISDKYLNINSDRHLNLNERFSSGLFARTERMMDNSLSKLKAVQEDVQEVGQKYSLFSDSANVDVEDDFVDEDEVKVNMKTALIAETYFGKKRKK